MKVVVCGQRWFGAQVLRLALDRGHEVAAVVAPRGDRLAAVATALWLPVHQVGGRLEPRMLPEGTDLILAAYAHCFIPAESLASARLGALAYHPSLLPRHRGRDAVRWAVHMREAVTGGTLYWMNERVDGGPIARQEFRFIRPDDDAAELWRRELAPLGLKLFDEVLAELESGIVTARDQDESVATWEPAFERPRLGSASS